MRLTAKVRRGLRWFAVHGKARSNYVLSCWDRGAGSELGDPEYRDDVEAAYAWLFHVADMDGDFPEEFDPGFVPKIGGRV